MGLIRDYLRYRKARKAWTATIQAHSMFSDEERKAWYAMDTAWDDLTNNRKWVIQWIS